MVAILLHGVLQLSERRASFVSAVTHELRTPLTTFQMYSEMLSEGMVEPAKQGTYLQTLRSEADRLAHLVENVLQYAKLERSRSGWQQKATDVGLLIDTMRERLAGRAAQCGLEVVWTVPDELAQTAVWTNASAVEQIMFNLLDNACKYGVPSELGRIDVSVTTSGEAGDWVLIGVRDYGPGVPRDAERRMFQPFSRKDEVGPAPGVGLGLTLCRRMAKQLGGKLEFHRPESGAEFRLRLPRRGK